MQVNFGPLDKAVKSWLNGSNNSMINPTLHRRANGPNYWYRLQFVEQSDDDSVWTTGKLDKAVEWAAEQLKNQKDCYRKAWDMWDFKSKRDAEKFITLFHLSWTQ